MPMTVKKSDYFKVVPDDPDPDTSFMDQEDFKEMKQAWENHELQCYGVQAAVELQIPYGQDFIERVIETPGIWGVFSKNKDDPYHDELFEEEAKILTDMLTAIGIIVVD